MIDQLGGVATKRTSFLPIHWHAVSISLTAGWVGRSMLYKIYELNDNNDLIPTTCFT
jgi:hypothetical protein